MDTATDMATATDTMATTARGRLSLLPLLRPPLLLSLATDTTAVVMVTDMDTVTATATDTMATMARGRLSLLLLLRLLLSPDMATTAVDTAMATDMAMATDVATDTAMDTATTVRVRTDCLQSCCQE